MYIMNSIVIRSACLISFCLALVNCTPAPDFGDTPKIYYDKITQSTELGAGGKKIRENITITVSFEDGDGNLGASTEEIGDPVFKSRYGNWGNYELVTLTKSPDGLWDERILSEDSLKWFPVLKPDKINGPVKGSLDLNFNRAYGNTSVPLDVRFKVRIRDRSLNVSNQIETDVINVPTYL